MMNEKVHDDRTSSRVRVREIGKESEREIVKRLDRMCSFTKSVKFGIKCVSNNFRVWREKETEKKKERKRNREKEREHFLTRNRDEKEMMRVIQSLPSS